MRLNFRIVRTISVVLFVVFLAGCGTSATIYTDPGALTWTQYASTELGYTLDYPTVFTLDEQVGGSQVMVKDGRRPVILVRFVDEAEAKSRGLWVGSEPVGEITLGGVAGKQYIYTHSDFLVGDRTVAYVIPYHDKFLGLEFRLPGELGPVEKQILASFA